ncbi:28286_t:CDS:1, partial [Gigaspora margarita]
QATNTTSTIVFRRHKAKVGTRISSSNIEGEQKTLEDWLLEVATLSILLCEKLEPF